MDNNILDFVIRLIKSDVTIRELGNVRHKLAIKEYTITKEDNISLLLFIFKDGNAKTIYNYFTILKNWDLLKYFHPQIAEMEKVLQSKAGCIIDNNLEHTLRVIKNLDLLSDIRRDATFKLACLYHDIGKGLAIERDGKFLKHPEYSAQEFVKDFAKVIPHSELVRGYILIKNHMLPHAIIVKEKCDDEDYNRRFVYACDGYKNAIDVITIATIDKAASHKEKYLKPYTDMLEKYSKELQQRWLGENKMCPICLMDGAEKELSVHEEPDKTMLAYCEFCKTTYYFDKEGIIIPTNRIDIYSDGRI